MFFTLQELKEASMTEIFLSSLGSSQGTLDSFFDSLGLGKEGGTIVFPKPEVSPIAGDFTDVGIEPPSFQQNPNVYQTAFFANNIERDCVLGLGLPIEFIALGGVAAIFHILTTTLVDFADTQSTSVHNVPQSSQDAAGTSADLTTTSRTVTISGNTEGGGGGGSGGGGDEGNNRPRGGPNLHYEDINDSTELFELLEWIIQGRFRNLPSHAIERLVSEYNRLKENGGFTLHTSYGRNVFKDTSSTSDVAVIGKKNCTPQVFIKKSRVDEPFALCTGGRQIKGILRLLERPHNPRSTEPDLISNDSVLSAASKPSSHGSSVRSRGSQHTYNNFSTPGTDASAQLQQQNNIL